MPVSPLAAVASSMRRRSRAHRVVSFLSSSVQNTPFAPRPVRVFWTLDGDPGRGEAA